MSEATAQRRAGPECAPCDSTGFVIGALVEIVGPATGPLIPGRIPCPACNGGLLKQFCGATAPGVEEQILACFNR